MFAGILGLSGNGRGNRFNSPLPLLWIPTSATVIITFRQLSFVDCKMLRVCFPRFHRPSAPCDKSAQNSLNQTISTCSSDSSTSDSNGITLRQVSEISKCPSHNVNRKWYHGIFALGGISLLICLLQILLPPPFGMRQSSAEIAEQPFSDGCADGMKSCVCPRETICADTVISMVLLALARCSAYFDYPLYMMMFLSKAHNINDALRRTPIREVVDFADMHHAHRLFGIVVGIETMFHSFFHILRWGLRGDDIQFLWQSSTGISGLIACLMTPLIVWPMVLPWLRNMMSFEWRKGLHFLSWLWAVALLYHAPSRIYLLIGIPALVYLVDRIFGFFFRTHLCDTVQFERYGGGGVVVEFKNPKGFNTEDGSGKTAYVYVMIPWLSRFQWHAFTLFPHPKKPNHSTLCIGNAGDWTKRLHDEIDAPAIKPAYFCGPFESEFSDVAIDATHCIAVASGIGITPTLSLIQRYKEIKRVNVIWTCRDAGLVEYFLHKMDLSAISQYAFLLIFYTGTRDLVVPKHLPANFFIFRSRPKLESTIAGIISLIERGEDLPEEMYENQRQLSDIPFGQRIKVALARVLSSYSREEIFEYGVEKTEELKHKDIQQLPERSGPEKFISRRKLSLGRRYSNDLQLKKMRRRLSNEVQRNVRNPPSGVREGIRRRHTNECTPARSPVCSPRGEISLDGLDATISDLLGGIGEYSIDDVKILFQQVDFDGSGHIDEAKLNSFFDMLSDDEDVEIIDKVERGMSFSTRNSLVSLGALSPSTRSSVVSAAEEQAELLFGGNQAVEHLLELSRDQGDILKDWSLFYCGGSKQIENDLRATTKKYGIGDLAVERFNW